MRAAGCRGLMTPAMPSLGTTSKDMATAAGCAATATGVDEGVCVDKCGLQAASRALRVGGAELTCERPAGLCGAWWLCGA
eukprot:356274-Chlamydomonas_euryale.AAC.12